MEVREVVTSAHLMSAGGTPTLDTQLRVGNARKCTIAVRDGGLVVAGGMGTGLMAMGTLVQELQILRTLMVVEET